MQQWENRKDIMIHGEKHTLAQDIFSAPHINSMIYATYCKHIQGGGFPRVCIQVSYCSEFPSYNCYTAVFFAKNIKNFNDTLILEHTITISMRMIMCSEQEIIAN